ncbi:DUF6586 family protein [Microbulbifer sp. ANSA001]|uniref:DUF6586 family protein n=1 Tax=Microbulbifer sp. ANSA001 TaxID=3243358 RepID=UPI004042921B
MSNPFTGQVASALRKAQLLLQLTSDVSPLQSAALEEAVVLQLWKAYRAFLVELSHQLQLGFEPESLQMIADSLETQGRASNEVKELQQLNEQPDSWLNQLLQAWTLLMSLPSNTEVKREAPNLIPIHNVGREPVTITVQGLTQWHKSMVELIRRQRANLEEC